MLCTSRFVLNINYFINCFVNVYSCSILQIEVYPLFRTYKLVVSNIVCTFANVNKCSLSRTFSRHSKNLS